MSQNRSFKPNRGQPLFELRPDAETLPLGAGLNLPAHLLEATEDFAFLRVEVPESRPAAPPKKPALAFTPHLRGLAQPNPSSKPLPIQAKFEPHEAAFPELAEGRFAEGRFAEGRFAEGRFAEGSAFYPARSQSSDFEYDPYPGAELSFARPKTMLLPELSSLETFWFEARPFLSFIGGLALLFILFRNREYLPKMQPNSVGRLQTFFSRPFAGPLLNWVEPMVPAAPPGDYRLQAAPSLTAAQIDAILLSYNSPAKGTGQFWLQASQKYQIDPAFAVAFFIHESTAGTNPHWAGQKADGTTTHNIGNIICAGYKSCHGRFRDYDSWEEGIEDWFRLIRYEYIDKGLETVDQIMPVYAPSIENDVQGYQNIVKDLVDSWRKTPLNSFNSPPEALRPQGNPLQSAKAVLTQGYGVGTHKPVEQWGAVDLALDGDGDGKEDSKATWGQPVFATQNGKVKLSRDTWPAGNHIWLLNAKYKTGYSHLQDFAVEDGQEVVRGQRIGSIGSSGQSNGPHLDYQVWQQIGENKWQNLNPLDFAALEK